MSLLGTLFFLIFVLLISIMPYFIMYAFSDAMRLIIQYIIKYRVSVISDNLKKAFPNKNSKEINTLINKAYKNLIDNLIEGFKTFSMRKSVIVKRHKLLNPEILEPFYKNQKSLIGVIAHYGNWEWGSLLASLQTPYKVVALYKPLNNKYIDSIIRKSRSRCGTELVSIYETSKTVYLHSTPLSSPYIRLLRRKDLAKQKEQNRKPILPYR